MNDNDFEQEKNRLMPIPLQEHFAKNRIVFQNNIKKYENMEKQLSVLSATDEQKAMFALMFDMAQALYGSAEVLLEHNEIAFFGLFTLREEIDRIRNSLNQQGIDIDEISKYKDILTFIDQYIKHSTKDDDPNQ